LNRAVRNARLALLGVCCAVVACEPSKEGCYGVGTRYSDDPRPYVDPIEPQTSEERAERSGRPVRSTLVELRNASTRTVWLGQRWFIVPSQLERDRVRNAVQSIEAELGCVCWCDALVDEWSPVCTRASCPAGAVAPGRESYAPLAPDEVRELDWDGDLTDLDPAAKCRYAVGYPPDTELAASLCWYDADPNEEPSAEFADERPRLADELPGVAERSQRLRARGTGSRRRGTGSQASRTVLPAGGMRKRPRGRGVRPNDELCGSIPHDRGRSTAPVYALDARRRSSGTRNRSSPTMAGEVTEVFAPGNGSAIELPRCRAR
jgi:hypothetical protein